jgi:hypothetical protein
MYRFSKSNLQSFIINEGLEIEFNYIIFGNNYNKSKPDSGGNYEEIEFG